MKLISWISLAALSLVTFSAMGQNNLILKNWESNKSLVEQSVENSLLSDFRDLLLPFSPLIGERSDVAYYFGILYAKMGKNHRAIGYFRQSLERDSDNSAARWGLAQALLLNQKWAEALSELNHLSENSSSSSFWRARKSEIIYYQGVCLFRLDKYSDARKKFIQSLYFENSSNAEQASSAQKFLKAIQSKGFFTLSASAGINLDNNAFKYTKQNFAQTSASGSISALSKSAGFAADWRPEPTGTTQWSAAGGIFVSHFAQNEFKELSMQGANFEVSQEYLAEQKNLPKDSVKNLFTFKQSVFVGRFGDASRLVSPSLEASFGQYSLNTTLDIARAGERTLSVSLLGHFVASSEFLGLDIMAKIFAKNPKKWAEKGLEAQLIPWTQIPFAQNIRHTLKLSMPVNIIAQYNVSNQQEFGQYSGSAKANLEYKWWVLPELNFSLGMVAEVFRDQEKSQFWKFKNSGDSNGSRTQINAGLIWTR